MSIVKLQVPMDKDIKEGLEKRAKDLGFDSAQAYIRFWAKAQINGREFYISEPEKISPSLAKLLAEADEEIARGDTFGPFNEDEAVEFLNSNTPETLGIENED